MKTLVTQILPSYEGVDSTHEVEIPDNVSWELKFHCEECGDELEETELGHHICTND